MGSDEFRDRVAAIAKATGEGGWPMPLPEELRRDLDSKLADLANITGHRWGSMLAAGLFLREFVPEGLPWAHIDIAGPAFNAGSAHGATPPRAAPAYRYARSRQYWPTSQKTAEPDRPRDQPVASPAPAYR